MASTLYDSFTGKSYPAYCDLKSEQGTAWTLVMSWNSRNRGLSKSAALPSRQTHQWTRTPKTGISIDWVWPEWDQCRLAPPTGEQHVAIRPRASISETTSVETSRTSTSSIILGEASAGEWNTSLSGDAWARLRRCLSGSAFMKACILTVQWTLTVNLKRQGLVLWVMKIILVGMVPTYNPKFRCTKDTWSTTQWWFGANL